MSPHEPDELGIAPVRFDRIFYCHKCWDLASEKIRGRAAEDHLIRSGTRVRERLRRTGFVCRLLNRNGAAAIAAAISPYRAVRDEVHTGHEPVYTPEEAEEIRERLARLGDIEQ